MPIQQPHSPLVPGLNKQLNKFADVPLIGPWTSRIGKVNRILGFPCHPSPEIWIEAFVSAALHGVLSIVSPTCIDYAMSRFGRQKPRGRHGAPGGPGPRKPRLHSDPYKVLPLGKIGLTGKGGLFALRGAELLRALGWWLTIIDATTDGLVNWTSLAYQWSGCDQPGSTGAQAHAIQGNVLLFQNVWLPVTDWIWDQALGVIVHGEGFYVPRGKSIHVSFSMSTHSPENIPACQGATAIFRLANQRTGEKFGATSYRNSSTGVNTGGGLMDYNAGMNDADPMIVEYFISGCGYQIIDSGHMTVTAHSVTSMFAPQQPCSPQPQR